MVAGDVLRADSADIVGSDPETRQLSLEEIDLLFTGSKIVMHIEDADVDLETAHATAPGSDLQAEKEAIEHVHQLPHGAQAPM